MLKLPLKVSLMFRKNKSFFTNLAEEEEEKRIRSKKRLIYSIIASVLILIIATSAYLVVEKKISVKQFKPFKFLNSGIPATPAILPVVTDQQQIDAFKEAESMAGLTIPDIKTIPLLPGIIPDPATATMPADTLIHGIINACNSQLQTPWK